MDVVKIAVLAAVLCAVHGQTNLPRCSSLRQQLFEDFGAVFRNGRNVAGACDHLCVNNNNRVRRFYACCPGNTVFVLTGRPTSSRAVNANNVVIICQTPPPTTPPPTTAAPLISSTSNRLSSCPSGPTRVTQYSPSSQERLCEYTCSFRVSVFGRPAGTRSRTVFRCCSGEPHVLSRALGIYGCPEAPQVPDGSGDQ